MYRVHVDGSTALLYNTGICTDKLYEFSPLLRQLVRFLEIPFRQLLCSYNSWLSLWAGISLLSFAFLPAVGCHEFSSSFFLLVRGLDGLGFLFGERQHALFGPLVVDVFLDDGAIYGRALLALFDLVHLDHLVGSGMDDRRARLR